MTLAMPDSNLATGTIGASSLSIRKVWPAATAMNVNPLPLTPECSSSNRACDISRLASGMEYRADLAGPSTIAIHVVDAQAASAPTPTSVLLAGSGYRGVLLQRAADTIAVVTNDTPEATAQGPFVYRVPAGTGAIHVVLDAPTGTTGRSDVTGSREGGDCKITVSARADSVGGFDGRPLVMRATSDCSIAVEGTEGPIDAGAPGPMDAGGATGAGGASVATTGTGGSSVATTGAGGASVSDPGGNVIDAGTPGAGGTTITVGSKVPAADVLGGCSCRASSGDAKSWPVAAFATAWMLANRRRSRRRTRSTRSERVGQPSDELPRVIARDEP
jgi:hypothetical protein